MIYDMQLRLAKLQEQQPHNIKLYALLDGIQYHRHFDEKLSFEAQMNAPLFREFGDADIAYAGGWLFDMASSGKMWHKISELEHSKPAVSWLFSLLSLEQLTLQMQQHLNVMLPGDKIAVLRFFDPRILHRLNTVFTPAQQTEFLQPIYEWHYLLNGEPQVIKGVIHA